MYSNYQISVGSFRKHQIFKFFFQCAQQGKLENGVNDNVAKVGSHGYDLFLTCSSHLVICLQDNYKNSDVGFFGRVILMYFFDFAQTFMILQIFVGFSGICKLLQVFFSHFCIFLKNIVFQDFWHRSAIAKMCTGTDTKVFQTSSNNHPKNIIKPF